MKLIRCSIDILVDIKHLVIVLVPNLEELHSSCLIFPIVRSSSFQLCNPFGKEQLCGLFNRDEFANNCWGSPASIPLLRSIHTHLFLVKNLKEFIHWHKVAILNCSNTLRLPHCNWTKSNMPKVPILCLHRVLLRALWSDIQETDEVKSLSLMK